MRIYEQELILLVRLCACVHRLSFAIHKYFNENGFYYMHTPIITGSDAEGAGEMFRVSKFGC